MYGPEEDGNSSFSHSGQSPALFLLEGTEAEYRGTAERDRAPEAIGGVIGAPPRGATEPIGRLEFTHGPMPVGYPPFGATNYANG